MREGVAGRGCARGANRHSQRAHGSSGESVRCGCAVGRERARRRVRLGPECEKMEAEAGKLATAADIVVPTASACDGLAVPSAERVRVREAAPPCCCCSGGANGRRPRVRGGAEAPERSCGAVGGGREARAPWRAAVRGRRPRLAAAAVSASAFFGAQFKCGLDRIKFPRKWTSAANVKKV